MWNEGKPHGIGTFIVRWLEVYGKFENAWVSNEIGTYFTPGERWARKGRRGFFPADSVKLAARLGAKLADEDHSESYRDDR